VVTGDEGKVAFLIGTKVLYRVTRKYVQRLLDGVESYIEVLEAVNAEIAYTFHSRILDVKVISNSTPLTYIALLETGEVCHSVTGILSYPEAKIISINALGGIIHLYLDDGTIRRYLTL